MQWQNKWQTNLFISGTSSICFSDIRENTNLLAFLIPLHFMCNLSVVGTKSP